MTTYDHLSDAQVLELAGNGRYGPGIIGQALYDRAKAIRERTDDGRLGPAIADVDYAKKEAAKREAAKAARATAAPDPDDEEDSQREEDEEQQDQRDPWSFVTLSGAKMLAQTHGVSYAPRVKRDALIEALKGAGIQPPAPPANPDADDDFDETRG